MAEPRKTFKSVQEAYNYFMSPSTNLIDYGLGPLVQTNEAFRDIFLHNITIDPNYVYDPSKENNSSNNSSDGGDSSQNPYYQFDSESSSGSSSGSNSNGSVVIGDLDKVMASLSKLAPCEDGLSGGNFSFQQIKNSVSKPSSFPSFLYGDNFSVNSDVDNLKSEISRIYGKINSFFTKVKDYNNVGIDLTAMNSDIDKGSDSTSSSSTASLSSTSTDISSGNDVTTSSSTGVMSSVIGGISTGNSSNTESSTGSLSNSNNSFSNGSTSSTESSSGTSFSTSNNGISEGSDSSSQSASGNTSSSNTSVGSSEGGAASSSTGTSQNGQSSNINSDNNGNAQSSIGSMASDLEGINTENNDSQSENSNGFYFSDVDSMVTPPPDELGPNGSFVVKDPNAVIVDENGNIIGSASGTYKVYEIMYDESGNIVAVRISKDGEEPKKWIYLNQNGVQAGDLITIGPEGELTIKDPNAVIVDENGNVVGTASGVYPVYEVLYDDDGNVIAVRISPDGEPIKWIYLNQNGVDIGNYVPIGPSGNFTITDSSAVIVDENGNIIGSASGTYQVYEVLYDDDGNIIAVRISPDGEPIKWIYLNQNGVDIGNFFPSFKSKIGSFEVKTGLMFLYDSNGNIIGILRNNNYDVYEIKYDENGNIIGYRITPDGVSPKWIYPNAPMGMEHIKFADVFSVDSSNSQVKLFDKKAALIGGLIGLLVIAAGSALYLKKKNGEKIDKEVKPGKYLIYNVDTDNKGNIKNVKVSDSEDEWIGIY